MQAQEALDLGFHLSYGGVLTFKTAEQVRESARITPDDRLLMETDAPYLAPIPYRGQTKRTGHDGRDRAEAGGGPRNHVEDIAAITTANFERVCLTGVCRGKKRPVTLRFPMADRTARTGSFSERDIRSRPGRP